MLNKILNIVFLIAVAFMSCNDAPPKDTQTSGIIKVSIDETYQPVMEEQIRIFQSNYPDAKIIAEYKPEADCIKDFIEDTTRMIFIARPLTDIEKKMCEDKKIYVSRQLSIARDAVAFIMSNKATKTDFTQKEFEEILKGKSQQQYQIVFDNQNSSTLSIVQDSILKGEKVTPNLFAAKGAADAISYVQKNKNAIGAIGVSWISDKDDSVANSFLKNIKVVGIYPNNDTIMAFRKPYQVYIGLKEYPYTRELYFISKETWVGLGTGFAGFLSKNGQWVFKKYKLFPTQVNVFLRPVTSGI